MSSLKGCSMTREELGITEKGAAYIQAIITWGETRDRLRDADPALTRERAYAYMQAARDASHDESMAQYRAAGMI